MDVTCNIVTVQGRIENIFTSSQALHYASQHIFLMFHIILSVSVFIHLSTFSLGHTGLVLACVTLLFFVVFQNYNGVIGNKELYYALTGNRSRTFQIFSPVFSPLHNDEHAQPRGCQWGWL